MKKEILYPGKAGQLYRASGLTTDNCLSNLDVFKEFRKKYTPEFIADVVTATQEAQALPDDHVRKATLTNLRIAAATANRNYCEQFMTLTTFIEAGFSADMVRAEKLKAGANYYREASHLNWNATSLLITTANTYVDNNAEVLLNGDMTEDFPAQLSDAGATFTDALTTFTTYKIYLNSNIKDKTTANNELYARLQDIMRDGKHIFRNDEAMRKLFSYEALLKQIKGSGHTGFRFALKAKDVLTPVTTASVSFMPTGLSFPSDENGIIQQPFEAGEYTYTLTAPGFATQHGKIKITAGVERHKKFILTAAAATDAKTATA